MDVLGPLPSLWFLTPEKRSIAATRDQVDDTRALERPGPGPH